MSANEVYLKFKAFFDDKVSGPAKKIFETVGKGARSVSGALGALSTLTGESLGGANKIVGSLGNIVGAFAALGPVGAIIGGITAAWGYFQDKIEKAREAAEKMRIELVEKINKMRSEKIKNLSDTIANAAKEAEKAASAFDAMASSYLKVERAKQAHASSKNDLVIAGMELDKSKAISSADEKDEAVVGAEKDLIIAEKKLAQIQESSADAVKISTQERKNADERLKQARQKEIAARELNQKIIDQATTVAGLDKEYDKALAEKIKQTEEDLNKAINDRIKAEGDAAAAAEEEAAAKEKAQTDVTRAKTAVNDADNRLTAAIRNRTKAEEEAAEEAEKKAKEEAKKRREKLISEDKENLSGLENQLNIEKQLREEKYATAKQMFLNPRAWEEQQRVDARTEQKLMRRFTSLRARYGESLSTATGLSTKDQAAIVYNEAKKREGCVVEIRDSIFEISKRLEEMGAE